MTVVLRCAEYKPYRPEGVKKTQRSNWRRKPHSDYAVVLPLDLAKLAKRGGIIELPGVWIAGKLGESSTPGHAGAERVRGQSSERGQRDAIFYGHLQGVSSMPVRVIYVGHAIWHVENEDLPMPSIDHSKIIDTKSLLDLRSIRASSEKEAAPPPARLPGGRRPVSHRPCRPAGYVVTDDPDPPRRP